MAMTLDINSVLAAVARRKYTPGRYLLLQDLHFIAKDNGMYAGFAGSKNLSAIRGGRRHCAASSARDGANAGYAGASTGPAGEGHGNEHQIHVLKVSRAALM